MRRFLSFFWPVQRRLVVVMFAWAYVILRIIHSVYQATINVVMVRFSIFLLSTLCLLFLAVHAVWQRFNGGYYDQRNFGTRRRAGGVDDGYLAVDVCHAHTGDEPRRY